MYLFSYTFKLRSCLLGYFSVFLNFFILWVRCFARVHVCMLAACVPVAYRNKRASNLELELQRAVSCRTVAGASPRRAASILNYSASFLTSESWGLHRRGQVIS